MLCGDIFTTPDGELLGTLAAFDVVLSDMAPNTTGVRATDQARSASLFEEALARAERLLAPGGAFVGKIFQSGEVEVIRKRMSTRFSDVRFVKPEGSRAESIEIYLAGKGLRLTLFGGLLAGGDGLREPFREVFGAAGLGEIQLEVGDGRGGGRAW